MSVEEMLELWKSGSWDECRKRKQILWCDMEGWDYAEEGEWAGDGKYQHIENVIEHRESGRCFIIHASRSGSYHTEWYVTFDSEPVEVVKVKKVVETTAWVVV